MALRNLAAPPTPWSPHFATPTTASSAYIHSSSSIIGDVRIGEDVLIAPGVSVRADEGYPFYIGAGSNIQDGAVVHGLEKGRVDGDDGHPYSVWIGEDASITHLALIHGPAYVGDGCFIGFRSTVFNARVGKGCIVMMHSLIENVIIPPGKYVASGSIITNQQQADRLPNVEEGDSEFATHVLGVNDQLRLGYRCIDDIACSTSLRRQKQTTTQTNGMSTSLPTEIVNQVSHLLTQGFKIGTEHADERRYRSNSWQSCSPFTGTGQSAVLKELEHCLSDHAGEYVRLLGIDSKAKRRVLEEIIQRPGQQPALSAHSSPAVSASPSKTMAPSAGGGGSDVMQLAQQWLSQNYQLSTEFADERRFKANSWVTGGSVKSANALSSLLAEHSGEYVRLIAIDPKAKRRIAEEIVQRPGGQKPVVSYAAAPSSSGGSSQPSYSTSSRLPGDVSQQVQQWLSQGYKLSTEFADERRFKANSWVTGEAVQNLQAVEGVLDAHKGEYVRLIAIDTKAKRRVAELIVQRA